MRQVSIANVQRLGINQAPTVERQTWTNKRTAEVHEAPKSIDPSWDYNLGAKPAHPLEFISDKLDGAQAI
jgi:hypothetical protein